MLLPVTSHTGRGWTLLGLPIEVPVVVEGAVLLSLPINILVWKLNSRHSHTSRELCHYCYNEDIWSADFLWRQWLCKFLQHHRQASLSGEVTSLGTGSKYTTQSRSGDRASNTMHSIGGGEELIPESWSGCMEQGKFLKSNCTLNTTEFQLYEMQIMSKSHRST